MQARTAEMQAVSADAWPTPATTSGASAKAGTIVETYAADRARAATHAAAPGLFGRTIRHGATWALVGYEGVRLVSLVVLYLWAHADGHGLVGQLGHKWDAAWYTGIAQHGYDGGFNPDRPNHLTSNLAFFPLLPALMRGLAAVTPLNVNSAGVAISAICGLAAAWGLFAIGRHLHSTSVGVILAVLWGVLPLAITESMAFSESLFTALAVWCLYATLTRRWVTAGLLCVLTGLTRPTAVALIAAVGLSALVAVIRRQDGWRPWVAGLLAPLGWLGYVAWVGFQTHQVSGYFHVQRSGWYSYWDGGAWTFQYVRDTLSKSSTLDFYLMLVVCVLALMLFVISLIDRQPWQLLVYSGVLLVITLGDANYFQSRGRFLVPAFPLLIPVAVALARTRRSKAVTVLVFLTAISAYLGGYLLEIWTYSF